MRLLTKDERDQAQDYCFRKSRRVRMTPDSSRWLIERALDELEVSPRPYEMQLYTTLCRQVRGRYVGNPILVWVLIRIVLPILVQLVLEWWKRRNAHFAP